MISEILGLFLDTMTADDKYSLCNKENVQQPIQMELSKKQKTFPEFVASVLTCTTNFEHFEKKRWSLQLMYFRNYRLQKIWLDKCLKSLVPQHYSTVNMLKVSKYCWNLLPAAFLSHFVNVFTNSPMNSDIPKINIFKLYFPQSDEKIR